MGQRRSTRQKSLESIEQYWQNGGHWERAEAQTMPTTDWRGHLD
ncbi:MAG TPA: hypothetical protein VHD63_26000 [Ktedonobacteraceae bacterium]|nr:hypothetical protein [Ktedonobacteraceae bacterium]